MKILIDNFEGHICFKRIEPYWKKNNIITTLIDQNSDAHLGNVRFTKNINKPKILRLDSVYYDTDTNFNIRNSDIGRSHSIADGIIYQSEFSKMMCERYLTRRKGNAKYSVIHNGINSMWCGQPIKHDGFNIVVSAKWRRHKRLKETIDLFLKFNKIVPYSKLFILGKLHDNKEIKNPNIKYFGHLDHIQMKDVFRLADVSIHLSKKDSCPNSVVETIGAGIPTITTNTCGGATEMCNLTTGCIVVDGDGIYEDTNPCKPYSDDYNKLSNKLENNLILALLEIEKDRRRVILPEQLTAEYTAKKYLELIEGVM